MNKYLIFLITAISIYACKAQKNITSLNDYKNNIISFSSGGGFTGIETSYFILENGQVYTSTGVAANTITKFTTISKKQTKSLFEKAAKIDWLKPAVNDPGNIYYTLSFGKNNEMKKQIWGNKQQNPSQDILDFYTELNKIIIKK